MQKILSLVMSLFLTTIASVSAQSQTVEPDSVVLGLRDIAMIRSFEGRCQALMEYPSTHHNLFLLTFLDIGLAQCVTKDPRLARILRRNSIILESVMGIGFVGAGLSTGVLFVSALDIGSEESSKTIKKFGTLLIVSGVVGIGGFVLLVANTAYSLIKAKRDLKKRVAVMPFVTQNKAGLTLKVSF